MNRRRFLMGAAGVSLGGQMAEDALANTAGAGVKWTLGCFNRPWSKGSFDEALDGMKAAGFQQIGLLGDHTGEAFIYPEATSDSLKKLSERISARGLKVIMGRMRTRFDIPYEESLAEIRKQIDNAVTLKLKYLMALGADKPEEYDRFYQVMTPAAEYAKSHRIQIAFKPHGGCTASADEIERCIERVGHPNFRLWYDAGNIIHYTDKDPVADAERIARYATGFCAKDCAQRGGDVMLQFGDGKVDFPGVFGKLKTAGFKGPVMIECCAGQTPAEVTENARKNRLFLERVFSRL